MTQHVFKKLRNSEIVRMIDEQHMTKTAVAKWFNISKQRVWQIYSREKLLPLIESEEKEKLRGE